MLLSSILWSMAAFSVAISLFGAYSASVENRIQHLDNIAKLGDRISAIIERLLDSAKDEISDDPDPDRVPTLQEVECTVTSLELITILNKVQKYYNFVAKCPFYYTRDSARSIYKKFSKYEKTLNSSVKLLNKLEKDQ